MLDATFSLKDLGKLHSFLGIGVVKLTNGSLFLHQKKYKLDLLDKEHMTEAKRVHTPMRTGIQLLLDDGNLLDNPTFSRSIVRGLQYPTITRLDLMFAVNKVCQFMASSRNSYYITVKRILCYLKRTMDFGMEFKPSTRLSIITFVDAGWTPSNEDIRSTSRLCVFLGANVVVWLAKK